MKAYVSSIRIGAELRDVRLWIGVLVGAALGMVLAIAQPPALGIVLIGLSLWLVLRRRAGHDLSVLLVGVLVGIAVVVCVFMVAILVHQGTPTTGHGSSSGSA
jgi:Mn2+/Fe2+ NRAMP family transporter